MCIANSRYNPPFSLTPTLPIMPDHASSVTFNSFGLSDALIQALDDVGYETPSAIQEQCITHLIKGS